LDAATGAFQWQNNSFFNGQVLAIDSGRLYSGAGHIEIYDPTGTQGCFVSNGIKMCSPVITLTTPDLNGPLALANGVLYLSGVGGIEGSSPSFKAYDASKLPSACQTLGACPPDFQAPDVSTASGPPAIVDGFVYVTSADGTLHAYDLPS